MRQVNWKRQGMRLVAIVFNVRDADGVVIDTFDIKPGCRPTPRRIKKFLQRREPHGARIERFNVRAAVS